MLFVGDVYDLKISVAAGISGTNYCIRPRDDLYIPTALINQFIDLGTRILLKSQHTILQTVPRGINGFLQRGILCRPALVDDLCGPPVRAGMVGPPGTRVPIRRVCYHHRDVDGIYRLSSSVVDENGSRPSRAAIELTTKTDPLTPRFSGCCACSQEFCQMECWHIGQVIQLYPARHPIGKDDGVTRGANVSAVLLVANRG